MVDVIVIGAGHAGCESALASARMGRKTLLITMSFDNIAYMPCNPSIGGPAKGIVVKEIDALGGEMGRNINKTLIQIKMLNQSKGPAVRSLRAQADKIKYPLEMKKTLFSTENLELIEDEVLELIVENGICLGVKTRSQEILSKSVVITSGTYMSSKILQGEKRIIEGPDGQKTTANLSDNLSNLGLDLLRFKTGTPPRIKSDSINWKKTQIQPGDDRDWSFSYFEKNKTKKNVPCYLTYTNSETHKIITDNFEKAPMFSGDIKGVGPRYCPSIEDKVNRFYDKERHQIFLEPESELSDSIYIQGLSSSFSEEIQDKFIRTIPGLEKSEILKYAYAIEYDVIDPIQLNSTLEIKKIKNLFSAGQINGTSGYEEAAGQGILSGINAALNATNDEKIILSRTNSYIGTMIDDIVTKGVTDPYRLLTSRSEYRLILRNDNAHMRLSKLSNDIGLLSDNDYEKVLFESKEMKRAREILEKEPIDSNLEVNKILESNNAQRLIQGCKAIQLIKRPDVNFDIIKKISKSFDNFSNEILEMVEVSIKYEGYISKMMSHIKKSKSLEKIKLPSNFDYSLLSSLSLEATEKLNKTKPMSIYQASRISGITPSDISILQIKFGNNNGL